MAGTKVLLEKQTARLQAETNRLGDEFTALKGDSGRVEKEARERFGYLGVDEIIYPRYNFHVKNIMKREPVTLSLKNRWKAFLFDGPVSVAISRTDYPYFVRLLSHFIPL